MSEGVNGLHYGSNKYAHYTVNKISIRLDPHCGSIITALSFWVQKTIQSHSIHFDSMSTRSRFHYEDRPKICGFCLLTMIPFIVLCRFSGWIKTL